MSIVISKIITPAGLDGLEVMTTLKRGIAVRGATATPPRTCVYASDIVPCKVKTETTLVLLYQKSASGGTRTRKTTGTCSS